MVMQVVIRSTSAWLPTQPQMQLRCRRLHWPMGAIPNFKAKIAVSSLMSPTSQRGSFESVPSNVLTAHEPQLPWGVCCASCSSMHSLSRSRQLLMASFELSYSAIPGKRSSCQVELNVTFCLFGH